MLYKIKLKNADDHVLLSSTAYDFIEGNEYYKQLKVLENLRLHASGYVFFQKNYPKPNGGYQNITIYLHKLIAEKYVEQQESQKRLFVRIKNGNPLDCREKNLEWATMAELRRNQKHHHNKTGYRGVVKVSKNTYRSVLYSKGERFDLGLFPSAESAAQAYNKKSQELFGKTKSLNKVEEADETEVITIL
ncbi:Pathogenesis-related transcriptional factor and ERF protein [Flammeovirga pectinis]|uniref:Pathogenesis-related transcriptional factor and ERF protein n=1 Tax=Flammeovirga pectinis TaxID=2494373 RepID=A0A3S9P5X2_9BACT|nr:Pathogenesis-related transcriptional factor and ERF protein [Flammeovirga pectinis]AZQ63601.1 Pathogenesis-related transcriptional factor and ERF protein [Flammeovirga pectinis]